MTEQEYDHYSMSIQWEATGQIYVVTVPELPGCKTHGVSYEEAIRQGRDAIESWVDARRASERIVPPAKKIGECMTLEVVLG